MDETDDWLLRQNGLKRIGCDGQIGGGFERCLDGRRDSFVGDIDKAVGGENFDSGCVEIKRRAEGFVWNPIVDAIVDGQLGVCGIDCK